MNIALLFLILLLTAPSHAQVKFYALDQQDAEGCYAVVGYSGGMPADIRAKVIEQVPKGTDGCVLKKETVTDPETQEEKVRIVVDETKKSARDQKRQDDEAKENQRQQKLNAARGKVRACAEDLGGKSEFERNECVVLLYRLFLGMDVEAQAPGKEENPGQGRGGTESN